MDLAGRRIQKDFVDNRIPELLKTISGYCPAAKITVTIDWDTFEGDRSALENLWLVWEQPSQGLEAVCSDDLGKEAVAETIHQIVIRNVASDSEVGAEVDADALIVRMHCADGASGTPGWSVIERVVSEAL